MKRTYKILSLVFFAILSFQCKHGHNDIIIPVVPTEPITGTIQGNVFDETGKATAGVTVLVGSKTATTNGNGYFHINDAALDKKVTLVTATKAGYFKAYRIFGATSGANNVELKLIKKVVTGTISGATGGELALTNGSKVGLPANGVVNATTNVAYTGTVNVYAAYIDPAASEIDQTVPGSFVANKDGKRVTLTSYGMLAVELESSTGEKLQIKSGANATLTTAIPAAKQTSAPATIALWSIDEATGIWKQEGTATRNGTVYVGTASHLSFWSCNVPSDAIWLSMSLKTSADDPLVRTNVRLKIAGTDWSAGCITDSLGQLGSYVPANSTLVMELLDYCGVSFFSQNLGPYTQNTDLGTVTATNVNNRVVRLSGRLVDCNNNAVTNGYALITYGYFTQYVRVDASGNFKTIFLRCVPATYLYYYITAVDAAGPQPNTTAIQYSAAVGGSTGGIYTVATGPISTCVTSVTEFINYTLDGINYSMTPSADSVTGQSSGGAQIFTAILGFHVSNAMFGPLFSITFLSASTSPGVYQVSSLHANINNTNVNSTGPLPFNVTITNFPISLGAFYEGSFSGSFVANGSHTINATFRVKRR